MTSKNKIASILLASMLCAGTALPAFAQQADSAATADQVAVDRDDRDDRDDGFDWGLLGLLGLLGLIPRKRHETVVHQDVNRTPRT